MFGLRVPCPLDPLEEALLKLVIDDLIKDCKRAEFRPYEFTIAVGPKLLDYIWKYHTDSFFVKYIYEDSKLKSDEYKIKFSTEKKWGRF